jgi:hypothetical protein
MALGQERAAAVANMESMGFLPADINRAMRAAFFNPDRAVEYLLNVGSMNTASHFAWLTLFTGNPGAPLARG